MKRGFFDLITDSWNDYKAHFLTILVLFLLFGAIPAVLLAWVGAPMAGLDSQGVMDYYKTGSGQIYLTLGIAVMFISALLSSCLIYMAFHKTKFKESLKGGLRYWGGYILLSILIGILLFLMSLPSFVLVSSQVWNMATTSSSYIGPHLSNGLSLFVIIIGLLCLILPLFHMVSWTFGYYSLVFENNGITKSLKRSKELVKGKWFKVFGFAVALMILFSILSTLVVLFYSSINSWTGNSTVDVTTKLVSLTTTGFFIQTAFSILIKLFTIPFGVLFFKNFFLDMKGK